MIKLFESSEQSFKSNGFGVLSDALTCVVKEALNGEYELEMTYPVTGKHFSDIEYERILYVKPNVHDDPQPFRIYEISAEIDGKITVNAEHISYDASGIPIWSVAPYYVDTPNQLIQYISKNSIVENPFTISTDITTVRQLNLNTPRSMRSLMGTDDNSLLSWYGGEWKYDKFKMKLLRQRGSDKGIYIRYGKNLLDLNQERNIQSTYSGVLPYYYNEDDGFQYLSERIISCPGTHIHTKIYTLDLSSEFQEMPTESDLRAKTNEFITENQLGIPAVNLTVSFLAIDEVRKTLLDVELGDTVHVRFAEMGITSDARVISYEYDALAGRYSSIELGKTVSTIVDSITDIGEHITNINKTIEKEAERTTVRFEALDDRIESEVTALKGADEQMSSLITQTANEISSEVSRASKAEDELSSRITQTANEISSKVTAGEVSSIISQSATTIRMQASALVVNSDNFKLDANGNITAAYCKFLCTPGTGGNMDAENGLWFDRNGIYFRYHTAYSSANGGVNSSINIKDSQIGLSSGCVNISGNTIFTWGGGGTADAPERKYIATREWVRQQRYANTDALDNYLNDVTDGSTSDSSTKIKYAIRHIAKSGQKVKATLCPINFSDERLKEEIKPLQDMTDIYMSLEPISFKFKRDIKGYNHKTFYGFGAGKTKKILEEHGFNTSDMNFVEALEVSNKDYFNEKKYCTDGKVLSIDKDNMHAMHVQMIQKLMSIVNSQEKRIRKLEEGANQNGY